MKVTSITLERQFAINTRGRFPVVPPPPPLTTIAWGCSTQRFFFSRDCECEDLSDTLQTEFSHRAAQEQMSCMHAGPAATALHSNNAQGRWYVQMKWSLSNGVSWSFGVGRLSTCRFFLNF